MRKYKDFECSCPLLTWLKSRYSGIRGVWSFVSLPAAARRCCCLKHLTVVQFVTAQCMRRFRSSERLFPCCPSTSTKIDSATVLHLQLNATHVVLIRSMRLEAVFKYNFYNFFCFQEFSSVSGNALWFACEQIVK